LALLLDHLGSHARHLYRIEPERIVELASGRTIALHSGPPLAIIGRLVQEDFCLLQKRDGAYLLTAAVLCFPSHWSLAEKLGKPLIAIHAPVPGYVEELAAPVARLFDTLQPEKPVQRLNWSLVDTDALFLPPAHRTEPVRLDKEDVAERVRLRVERQTLRRLPDSRAVVFGIRTHVTPLDRAIDTKEAAEALLARLHELPGPMQAYKNLLQVKPALLAFLAARRAAAP
jgi:hypothetical protein